MTATAILPFESATGPMPDAGRSEALVSPSSPRRPRIALYSHDTMGLGHVRRNALVAEAIARSVDWEIDVLLISGAREAHATRLPRGFDSLTLPALRKHADGSYGARSLRLPLPALIALRSETVRAALVAYEPDLLVVDNVPRGAVGELSATLEALSRRGRTRLVLGLRDIGDDAAVTRLEWERSDHARAIARYYDQVWIYGDPSVYDRARLDGLSPALDGKIRFAGYLDQRARAENAGADFAAFAREHVPTLDPHRPFALCLVGGGQDGARLAEAFADAEFGAGRHGVVVAGPFCPAGALARLRARARARGDLHVVDAVGEPAPLVAGAECVVSMGGYNSMCEIASYGKRALVVPRTHPRVEQRLRAERFRAIGAIDAVLLPDELDAAALSRWMCAPIDGVPTERAKLDLGGLARVAELARELLASTAPSRSPFAFAPGPASVGGGH